MKRISPEEIDKAIGIPEAIELKDDTIIPDTTDAEIIEWHDYTDEEIREPYIRVAQAQLDSCEKEAQEHMEEEVAAKSIIFAQASEMAAMTLKDKWQEEAEKEAQEKVREIIEEIDAGLTGVYINTMAPNAAFHDGSQEHLYMARMYALEKMIAGIGQALKQEVNDGS